jgi:glutamyl/glutaminyl-tRNA synthetase
LADHGDVVLWRREDLPAYHLASVVSDNQLGITTVVRGADLLASSSLHTYLADNFGLVNAQEIEYLHHDLIRSGNEKLSKSQNAPALVRNEQTKQQLFELTKTFELF